jgi:hypothetical protein
MSIAQRIGLTDTFQTTLLILALVMALAPYLPQLSIGTLTIPKLTVRQRRLMKVVGPLALLVGIALVTPLAALAPAPRLRLLAADATGGGPIDVAVMNEGARAVLLTGLEIEVISDRGGRARPMLEPAGTYRVPVDALRVGARRAVVLRHVVPPGATERLLIAPMTTRLLDLRVTLREAGGGTLAAEVHLWPGPSRG